MRENGFLGPIGDDLPSLIPVVFALMLFFGAFGTTFGAYNSRGKDFDLQIEALRISTELKGNSYFSGFEEFRTLCDSISAKGIKFRGGLAELNQRFDIFAPQFHSFEGKEFKCTNVDEANSAEDLSRQKISQQVPITRDFPIALNENNVVKPKSLVITVWR